MTLTPPAATLVGSVGAQFLERCERSAGEEAFRCPVGDGSWASLSWQETARRATELAAGLLSLGVSLEQRVAIASATRIEWVLADLAVTLAGAATTTVYPSTGADDVGYIVADCAAVVAFAEDATQVAKLRGPDGWTGAIRHVVAFEPVDDPAVLSLEDLAALGRERLLADPAAVRAVLTAVGPQHLATIVYTSGTTGRPKGVVHGASLDPAVMRMAQDGLRALWGYRADDIHVVAGPLYHSGPSGYANSTLYTGGTVVVLGEWDPRAFLEAVERHRVTTTFLTPAHFIRILEVPEGERAVFDTSSLRHVIHAGAPCPVPVKQRIIDALPSAEIWELYGASEGGATRVGPDEWRSRPGTVGLPWPGVEIRIVDPDTGARLGPGEDGLIYVKPAAGRFEYHNDPAKTSEAWADDAFTVGDIGHLDDDGYLFITDRRTDMVIRGGVNLYPREVEEVLHRHPDIVDCAVFGVPDERDGEHLRAVVEARRPLTDTEVAAWCRDRLDPYKCPSEIGFVDLLPRDPNGKVLKRHLRDEAWAGRARSI
jgi:long-chain acyl-CoA synthetase